MMFIPPKYVLTPKISGLLQSIEASKEVINSINIPIEIELNIKRRSTLKSSLYSARIEGNTATEDNLSTLPSSDQRKREVFNILRALNLVFQKNAKDLSVKDILNLHSVVMAGLLDKYDLGKFRMETGAIFNSAGIAIYLPPRPAQILPLMERTIKFINSSKEPFIPIRASLAHYTFEKIHPFIDGNGRVGRLILQAVLHKGGYGMKGLASIEQYLDTHRSLYYQSLEDTDRDVTNYLEFMLEAIAKEAEKAKEEILDKQNAKVEDYLLPRRAEILNIIQDHTIINFDTLRRRFMAVNERTLRYDLKYLQDQGLIKKRGSTKGVWYEPASQGDGARG